MIGNRIKQVRKFLKMSQSQFGKVLGTTQRAVSHWERNEAEPSLEQLQKLTQLFNINPTWLLTGQGEMFLNNNQKSIGVNYGGVQIGNIIAETIGTVQTEKHITNTSNLEEEIKKLIDKEIKVFQRIQEEKPEMFEKALKKLSRDLEELEELILS